MTTFGFSGVNRGADIKNNYAINTALELSNLVVSARVLSIVLDESHPRFKELGEWNGLGVIEYEPISTPFQRPLNDGFKFPTASPLTPNLKNYPLVNEIIYLIPLPNTNIKQTTNSIQQYYINITGIWNHPHHNAYPATPNSLPSSQEKDYVLIGSGSFRRIGASDSTDQSTEIFLGKTFKERSDIHPLLPFEGDVIYEGRWGNSIRLGSTVKGTPNVWSSAGEDGDPIIIIRNGQGLQTKEGWIPITENLSTDNSSIYLTSTQNIPILASSVSYISYPDGQQPTFPKNYIGKQIILDSGRLVFNAYEDHLLLSSAKSINLNSQESVNIDTKKFITQADKIFLGKEDLAKEPLLLGDTTVNLLKDLIYAIKEIILPLQNLTSAPVPVNGTAIFPQLLIPMTNALTCLESLETQLGTTPENCTLTSKRNFTL
jgi:hypothetical protein